MAQCALMRLIQPRRKSNSYLLAGDHRETGGVRNKHRLDADLADGDGARSKLSKNMHWLRRNEGDDPMGTDGGVAAFVPGQFAVCVNTGGHIHGDDGPKRVVDGRYCFAWQTFERGFEIGSGNGIDDQVCAHRVADRGVFQSSFVCDPNWLRGEPRRYSCSFFT